MKTVNKLGNLERLLRDMGSVLVAYSGGTDSTFLMFTAHEVLGDKSLAVFSHSPISPPAEREESEYFARKHNFRYVTIPGLEMSNPDFIANPPDRCYYCRKELFRKLRDIADAEGLIWIADGNNHDDLTDYRPGRKAAAEAGVRSPLAEAGLTKDEIRRLSREKGLPTWNKPASPCLASRVPYGTPITSGILDKIAAGEKCLHGLGLRQLRLRHHGDIARLELDEKEMSVIMKDSVRRELVARIKALGYKYVTLDLTGYRTGSLNIDIKQE